MNRKSRATYLAHSMAGQPLPRIALTIAAVLTLGPGTARAYLPGDPDPTFNAGQQVVLNFARANPGSTLFTGGAVDAQGRILVTGSATDASGRSALLLARFGADGTLDTSFGDGGSVVLQLGLGSPQSGSQSLGWEVGPRLGGGWLVIGAASVGEPNVFTARTGALVSELQALAGAA
jgi:hypothetical protein